MGKTSHLVLVIDCNPVHWHSKVTRRTSRESTSSFTMDDENDSDELNNDKTSTEFPSGASCKQFNQLLNQIHLYATTFLMFSDSNRISILVTLGPAFPCQWLVQNIETKQLKTLKSKFKKFFAEVKEKTQNPENINETASSLVSASPIAESLGMALCYLNKLQVNKSHSKAAHATQTGVVSTDDKKGSEKTIMTASTLEIPGKILLISHTSQMNLQTQYLNLINSAFCAKEHGIVVDIIVLDKLDNEASPVAAGAKEGTFTMFSQVSDLTKGVLHHCRELSYLYHLLTICVTPTFDDREKLLVTSSQVEVDYRAATFDTKRLVDIGFVCSICLAVFEFYQPLCPICDSNMSLSYKNNGNENKKK